MAGRGAFGTVLCARWARGGGAARGAGAVADVLVALKALQPVPPPVTCDTQAHQAYKVCKIEYNVDNGNFYDRKNQLNILYYK